MSQNNIFSLLLPASALNHFFTAEALRNRGFRREMPFKPAVVSRLTYHITQTDKESAT